MKRLAFLAVVACLCGGARPGTGRADIITFGTQQLPLGFGTYTEGAFTTKVVSGIRWNITSQLGNPPAALITGFSAPHAGDEVDIFLTGGGLFTFDSFQFAAGLNEQSDTVNLIGEVGGVQTQELSDLSSSSSTFQTMSPGFSAPIDTLRIVVVSAGRIDLDFDNLVLTPVATAVPEPASLTLMGLGVAGLVGYGWRRRRATA